VKRVLTAVVLIPLVLLILFRAPSWLFTLVIGVVAIICTREYLAIAEAHGIVPFRRLTLVGLAALFLGIGVRNEAVFRSVEHFYLGLFGPFLFILMFLFLSALPLWFLVRGMGRNDLRTVLPGAAASTFAFAYPAFPLLLILFLRDRYLGQSLLLFLLLTVWVGDIAAYYVGRSIGRRPLAPRISPQKSWEGAIASGVMSGLVGLLFLKNLPIIQAWLFSIGLLTYEPTYGHGGKWDLPLWTAILMSLSINIAAQLGDLVESMLKRGAGVKDSGNLLPGHGGMLDRIDALLFAVPVLWYYATFGPIPF
jgi:phosphatidate cytidylyltransferase